MSKKVQVDFIGNDTQFERTAKRVMGNVNKLTGLSTALKSSLVGALGGVAISQIVSHMSEYAKAIDDASKKLSLTIDETYELKKATKSVGMEFESMFGVRSKMEDFLQSLVDMDNVVFSTIGQKFGLKGQERWLDALRTMLKGGINRNELSKIVGPETANWLNSPSTRKMFMAEQGGGINAGAVSELANFKRELGLAADEIANNFLPAVAEVVKFIDTYILQGALASAAANNAAEAAGMKKAQELGIQKTGGFFSTLFSKTIRSPKILAKIWTEQGRKELGREFGPGGWQSAMFSGNEDVRKAAQAAYNRTLKLAGSSAEARRQAALEREKALAGPPDRQRIVPPSAITTSNPFLQIGGLMGVDTMSRLMTLNERIANATEQTAANTTPGTTSTPPVESPLAHISGVSGVGGAGGLGSINTVSRVLAPRGSEKPPPFRLLSKPQ